MHRSSFKSWNLQAFGGFKSWNLKAFGGVKSWDLKDFVENPSGAEGAHNKIPAIDCIELPKRKSPLPVQDSLRILQIDIYKNPQTQPKASLRRKGLGAGRNFTSKVSKNNTLPIQISFTLVETSGGTTSVGL